MKVAEIASIDELDIYAKLLVGFDVSARGFLVLTNAFRRDLSLFAL